MKNPTPSTPLLALVSKLKACPAQDSRFSRKLLIESWGSFRLLAPEHGDEITPALMAGLVLYDKTVAQLLNEAERAQLNALAKLALGRYEEKTHPPNKLGKTIAAALKESS